MPKQFYILFIFSILIFSCKKKDSSTSNNDTSTLNTTGSTTGTSSGINGVFLSAYNTTDYGNNSFYLDSTVQASFYLTPSATNSMVNAGTLTVNSIPLSQYSNNDYNSTNQINLKSLSWQISGNGTITASSFSYVPVYPIYSGYSMLPDTVIKSSGFTFSVTGITNSNEPVYLTIDQSGTPISRTITSTPAIINVTAAELAGFMTGNTIIIRLSMFNYSPITLNSKQYAINSNRTYKKYCYLK